MNHYSSGRTQGQNDVKGSPNSYGLYNKTQYDNNYNSGYSAGQNAGGLIANVIDDVGPTTGVINQQLSNLDFHIRYSGNYYDGKGTWVSMEYDMHIYRSGNNIIVNGIPRSQGTVTISTS